MCTYSKVAVYRKSNHDQQVDHAFKLHVIRNNCNRIHKQGTGFQMKNDKLATVLHFEHVNETTNLNMTSAKTNELKCKIIQVFQNQAHLTFC